MLELGDNVGFLVRSELSRSLGQKIEVQFPALYHWFEEPDWYWWITELDMVAGDNREGHYYTFYTQCTLEKLPCHQSNPSDFVFFIFDEEAEIWTEDTSV